MSAARLQNQMEALVNSGNTLQGIVFAPNRSWVVFGANGYRWYSGNFPQDAENAIEALINSGNTFQNVVFARPRRDNN